MSYYRPYSSGGSSPAISGSGSELSDTDSEESPEDRRLKDPRYAILRAAGPNLTTSEAQQRYMNGPGAIGAPWDETTNIQSMKDHVYLDPPKSTKTSLVSIKSTNRDKKVWPTPFRFQVKLPRTYKDVTKFQLVQMSFPNNASNVHASDLFTSSLVSLLLSEGVPSSCINTCVSVMNCTTASNTVGVIEQGRTNTVGTPLLTSLSVPLSASGLTDSQMAAELTTQANSTPPLNLISYSDFQGVFQTTRDVSVLFSEPGDNYVSPLTNQRLGQHTKEHIMNTYYTQKHVDMVGEITDAVAFVAYYFPVLKEAIGTGRGKPFLNPAPLSYEDMVSEVLGPFQGLDSELYYELCSSNQGALDGYRPHLTFELRPINSYKWSYHAGQRRFTTIHDTLHSSIVKDLSKQHALSVSQELAASGLNANSFSSLKTAAAGYQSVFKHMERNMSSVMGEYHMVSGVTFTGSSITDASSFTYSLADLVGDESFTTMFAMKSTFGRLYSSTGVPMSFCGFGDYHSTLSSYCQLAQSTNASVSSIQGRIMQDYHGYVSSKYAGVLPSSMIQSRSYVSGQGVPVSFVTNQTMYVPGMTPSYVTQTAPANLVDLQTVSPANLVQTLSTSLPLAYTVTPSTSCLDICCYVLQNMVTSWYSKVPVNTVINSLPYRLGLLNMMPGQFNIFSTVAQLTSTSNLNLLMQINDEQGFNNMDITMPENYMISNETTGQVKLIAGKILMGAIGDTGVSQTVIQNPTVFENTLGKLDKLDFKIYYDDENLTPAWSYLPYFLNISEWNATFQIDEQIGFASQAAGWGPRPTIPVPEDPDSTPYLFFTHKDNPNNS